jgi:hypothetical protein
MEMLKKSLLCLFLGKMKIKIDMRHPKILII